jgi:hypothetical protein
MTDTQCDVCGSAIAEGGILSGDADDADPSALTGTAARRCTSCGHLQKGGRHQSPLELLRKAVGALDSVIGLLLLLMLAGMVGIYVVAPLAAALGFLREGERLRPILLAVLVGSFSALGIRAAVKRELGPAVAAAGLGVLLLVAWVAWWNTR